MDSVNDDIDIKHLRAELAKAERAGDTDLATKLARQIDLLEDSLIIYRLTTPPRSST